VEHDILICWQMVMRIAYIHGHRANCSTQLTESQLPIGWEEPNRHKHFAPNGGRTKLREIMGLCIPAFIHGLLFKPHCLKPHNNHHWNRYRLIGGILHGLCSAPQIFVEQHKKLQRKLGRSRRPINDPFEALKPSFTCRSTRYR
jgi:hypothetical protein